ncbi:MAG: DUF2240 family protein [Halobacteriales archaeon]|nr:DUF2240 family protein [Halobacteriales archaeon]
MSLRAVVAAPFRGRGRDRLPESEFVVGLSLDRGWYSPDQASRVVDIAVGRGLLARDGDTLEPGFDVGDVDIPAGFTPDEELLRAPSPFEQALEALVEAGQEKQAAVAGINRLQADAGLTIGAAAVLYARRQGVDVPEAAAAARAELADQ